MPPWWPVAQALDELAVTSSAGMHETRVVLRGRRPRRLVSQTAPNNYSWFTSPTAGAQRGMRARRREPAGRPGATPRLALAARVGRFDDASRRRGRCHWLQAVAVERRTSCGSCRAAEVRSSTSVSPSKPPRAGVLGRVADAVEPVLQHGIVALTEKHAVPGQAACRCGSPGRARTRRRRRRRSSAPAPSRPATTATGASSSVPSHAPFERGEAFVQRVQFRHRWSVPIDWYAPTMLEDLTDLPAAH